MRDLQQLIENRTIRRFKSVRTRDLNQLSCFGKTMRVGELTDGEARRAEL
jgi:hypothetical protein